MLFDLEEISLKISPFPLERKFRVLTSYSLKIYIKIFSILGQTQPTTFSIYNCAGWNHAIVSFLSIVGKNAIAKNYYALLLGSSCAFLDDYLSRSYSSSCKCGHFVFATFSFRKKEM